MEQQLVGDVEGGEEDGRRGGWSLQAADENEQTLASHLPSRSAASSNCDCYSTAAAHMCDDRLHADDVDISALLLAFLHHQRRQSLHHFPHLSPARPLSSPAARVP